MKIAGVDVVQTAKATFKDFREDDLQGSAAQVTYNVLFSVVPLLIFLTALSGFVARAAGIDDSMRSITTWLFDHMGTNQAQAVRDPIETVVQSNSGGLLSVGAVLALWGGKNAIAAVMKALNVAFDVKETRPFIKRNLVAIGLTVALGLALTLASAIFLAGAGFASEITEKIGLGDTWLTVWSYVRWPLIAAILVVAVSALYWAAPNSDAPFKYLTPGSVFSVVAWGIATVGLGFYFANFAGYAGGTYGALGGVLVFIFWINIMVTILLLGAELNSVIVEQAAGPVSEQEPAASASATVEQSSTGRTSLARPGGAAIPAHAAAVTPVPLATSVPRGTSTAGFTARPSAKRAQKPQSTALLSVTMGAAKLVLSARRLLNRFTKPKR